MRILVLLLLLVPGLGQARADAPPYWPLAKGTYWIYDCDVSYIEKHPTSGKNEELEKHLTWRSEVTDVVTIEGCLVAELHGFPEDLTWYDSTAKPSDTLILKIGSSYYQITQNAPELFQKLKANPANWRSCYKELDQAGLFLPAPLAEDQRFGDGPANQIKQRFCQIVGAPTPFDTKTIKGAPALKDAVCYAINMHENTDLTQLDFVPGLGITSYGYHHNGTTMEAAVRLVEFGQPAPANGK